MGHGAGGIASIGFRVKTGRATAVLLAGPAGAPQVLSRRDVILYESDGFFDRQPYHAELDLSAKQAADIVRRVSRTARKLAAAAVRELIHEMQDRGLEPRGVGIVVGSDADPTKIPNPHIRAHALEGRLYRSVLEAEAMACGLPTIVLLERGVYSQAAVALRRSTEQLERTLTAFGKAVGRPWRIDEKLAALAAWTAMCG